jgi:type III pantothenate kinase
MMLAVDIGNSTVSIGLSKDKTWIKNWKLETLSHESIYYYQQKIIEGFIEENVDPGDINQVVISSVVPDMTEKFVEFFSGFKTADVVLFHRNMYHLLPVRTSNPFELGTDLMANALAAYHRYGTSVLVIDFGTALTFTMVEKDGEVSGVNIAPGMITAIKCLSANTAQLREVKLDKPVGILGTNTIEAIQNGIIIGYEGLVSHMIKRIRDEKLQPLKAIATGGLAHMLPEDIFDAVDKNLTLDGLRVAGQLVIKAG